MDEGENAIHVCFLKSINFFNNLFCIMKCKVSPVFWGPILQKLNDQHRKYLYTRTKQWRNFDKIRIILHQNYIFRNFKFVFGKFMHSVCNFLPNFYDSSLFLSTFAVDWGKSIPTSTFPSVMSLLLSTQFVLNLTRYLSSNYCVLLFFFPVILLL